MALSTPVINLGRHKPLTALKPLGYICINNTKNILPSSPKAINVSYLLAQANWAQEASEEPEQVDIVMHVQLFGIFFVRKRRLCRKHS